MGCSPIKAVRELGSERSNTALADSNISLVSANIGETFLSYKLAEMAIPREVIIDPVETEGLKTRDIFSD